MAIDLDERARTVLARRRAHGKDDRLFLRLERGSLRTGVPWTLAVGWAPRRWPDQTLVLRHTGDVEVYMDFRIARYTQSRDLTISGVRLGPWEWLVVADPFTFEDMWAWERTHPLNGGTLSWGGNPTARDLVQAAQRGPATRVPSGKGTAWNGTISDTPASNLRSVTDGKRRRS